MKHFTLLIFLLIVTTFAADPGGYISESVDNHTLTLHPGRKVASLQITQSEFDGWNGGDFNNSTARNATSAKVYQYFRDDFDLIFFVLNNTSSPSGLSNQLINTASENSGMGMSVFNGNMGSSPTGSAGKLKAYVQFSRRRNIQYGPTLHEVAHMWANFVLDSAEQSVDEYGTSYHMQHWGYSGTGGATGGALGGFARNTLVDLGGGNWQANDGVGSTNFDGGSGGVNTVPYSDFEMFLAGYWPKDSVGTIRVFNGISAPYTDWQQGKFHADRYIDYSIADLEILKGVRTPSSATAQKDYRVLVVILTATELSASEWNDVAGDVDWFTQQSSDGNAAKYNYWEATRGLGTVDASGLYESLKSTVPTSSSSVVSSSSVTSSSSTSSSSRNFSSSSESSVFNMNKQTRNLSIWKLNDHQWFVRGGSIQNIHIFDILGSELNKSVFMIHQDGTLVNLESLPQGTYFIHNDKQVLKVKKH